PSSNARSSRSPGGTRSFTCLDPSRQRGTSSTGWTSSTRNRRRLRQLTQPVRSDDRTLAHLTMTYLHGSRSPRSDSQRREGCHSSFVTLADCGKASVSIGSLRLATRGLLCELARGGPPLPGRSSGGSDAPQSMAPEDAEGRDLLLRPVQDSALIPDER